MITAEEGPVTKEGNSATPDISPNEEVELNGVAAGTAVNRINKLIY